MFEVGFKELLAHALLAIGGGITYALKQDKKDMISFFSNLFMASFAGVIVGLIAFGFMGESYPYLAYAITGVSGHVGPPILISIGNAISKLIVDKLNSLGNKKQ